MRKAKEESPIVIADLRKSFGDEKVLNGIDLAVKNGETLVVLGRSGFTVNGVGACGLAKASAHASGEGAAP